MTEMTEPEGDGSAGRADRAGAQGAAEVQGAAVSKGPAVSEGRPARSAGAQAGSGSGHGSEGRGDESPGYDGGGHGGGGEGGGTGAAAAAPPPADPRDVSRFVEAFASQLVEAGMGRMPSRVFAALLASEEGVLTSAELSERLQVSPAAISGAVRYLASATMIAREREPGSRRECYRVHHDQWYEMLANREMLLRRWETTLREGIATVGPDSRPGQRIAETLEFLTFLYAEFTSAMDRWRKHRDEVFGSRDTRPD